MYVNAEHPNKCPSIQCYAIHNEKSFQSISIAKIMQHKFLHDNF